MNVEMRSLISFNVGVGGHFIKDSHSVKKWAKSGPYRFESNETAKSCTGLLYPHLSHLC